MRTKVRQRLGIAAVIGCVSVVGIGLSFSLLLMNFVIGLITALGGLATIVVSPVVPRKSYSPHLLQIVPHL
jgi:hypothetical protein